MIEGGTWLKVIAPLETLPLWVREGSIIPYGPDIDFVEQEVTKLIVLLKFMLQKKVLKPH